MKTFTYLPGERPDGLTLDQGFGFAGNYGYWYIDFVAEPEDHWLTQISGGVRLNVGQLARFSDETDRTDHYIDFLGDTVRLNARGNLRGDVTQIDMGAVLSEVETDFFRITGADTGAKEWAKALRMFIAEPSDNIAFSATLTQGVEVIQGQDVQVTHGGFADESALRAITVGDRDDLVIWQGNGQSPVSLDGGAGEDRLRILTSEDVRLNASTEVVRVAGDRAEFQGFERFVTGDGDDILIGTAGNDVLQSTAGRNQLRGKAGDDALYGGLQRDVLKGGQGADVLSGSLGRDLLKGGAGDDTLTGGRDNDRMIGGAGSDTFVLRASGLVIPPPDHDVISDFELSQDVVDLTSYRAFAQLDDVLAAAEDTADGVRVQLDDAASVLFTGLDRSDLSDATFLFFDT